MLRRLQREYSQKALSFLDDVGIVCLQEPSIINDYTAEFSFQGPDGTPYEKGIFTVRLKYPCQYPHKPVKICFTHPVFHPSVNMTTMDWALLGDQWSPMFTVDAILPLIPHFLSIIDEADLQKFKATYEIPVHLRRIFDLRLTNITVEHLFQMSPCWKHGGPRPNMEDFTVGQDVKMINGRKFCAGLTATDDIMPSVIVDLDEVMICDTPWKKKVKELTKRGLTVDQLLDFCEMLLLQDGPMPHFDASKSTTRDVVRGAIIPVTRERRCSYAQMVNETQPIQPDKMVTHHWNNLWAHTISAVIADALDATTYKHIAENLSSMSGIQELKHHLRSKRKSTYSYWICAMSVNQHQSICGGFGSPLPGLPLGAPERDSVNELVYPLCDCAAPKHFTGDECEMNKFDEMIRCLRKSNPRFEQVVAVDQDFKIFTRAWCVAELVESKSSQCSQGLKVFEHKNIQSHILTLENLDVSQCESSRPEDKQLILDKVDDIYQFNAFLRDLLLGPKDENGKRTQDKGLFFKTSQNLMAFCINPEAGSALIDGRKYFDAAARKHTAEHAKLPEKYFGGV